MGNLTHSWVSWGQRGRSPSRMAWEGRPILPGAWKRLGIRGRLGLVVKESHRVRGVRKPLSHFESQPVLW